VAGHTAWITNPGPAVAASHVVRQSMTILDRYIGLALARSALLVILVLLPLLTLLNLVQQLDEIGTGNYGLPDALIYELLLMPTYLLNLVPFTALLGTSMALGGLAHTNELTVMRAAGISIQRIGLATLKSGILFMLFVFIIMEWVAPPLHQQAIQRQSLALSAGELLIEKQGTWIHQGNRFINIRNKHEGHTLTDIHIFEFDPEKQQLKFYLHANQAEMKNRQQWLYKNLIVKNYQGKDVVTRHEAERVWESYLTEKQLRVMEQPINSLSPTGLYQYLKYLRASDQTTERFEMVFWQKATLPVTVIIMMLCSFPFVFGSLRSSSAGKRIVLATIAGFAFHLFSQSLVNLGLMLDLNPLLTTLLPIITFPLLAAALMRRAF
jgi:lipopolysaccharide export system permease protein